MKLIQICQAEIDFSSLFIFYRNERIEYLHKYMKCNIEIQGWPKVSTWFYESSIYYLFEKFLGCSFFPDYKVTLRENIRQLFWKKIKKKFIKSSKKTRDLLRLPVIIVSKDYIFFIEKKEKKERKEEKR